MPRSSRRHRKAWRNDYRHETGPSSGLRDPSEENRLESSRRNLGGQSENRGRYCSLSSARDLGCGARGRREAALNSGFLLDTHVLVRWLTLPKKLSSDQARAIREAMRRQESVD